MSNVTATDGVSLTVHRYTEIDPTRPTILAIHGFPDNHHVWDGVAQEMGTLGKRYNFVAYDVRGAGESSCPATRSGYALAQLVSDIGAVIDSLGVERVHLLGHDWGSIQAWAAVTDDTVMGKIGSFTSIFGPAPAIRGGVPAVGPGAGRRGPGGRAADGVGLHRLLPQPGGAGAGVSVQDRRESR
jgi:pimeloyl-ACP methyl ester carboxylesterase